MGNYVDELVRAFQKCGHCVNIIDSFGKTATQKMCALAGKTDIVFTFNATFVGMQQVKELFCREKFVTYLCDHPLFHKSRMDQLGDDCIVFTCDRRHEQYIRHYYPNIKDVFLFHCLAVCRQKRFRIRRDLLMWSLPEVIKNRKR